MNIKKWTKASLFFKVIFKHINRNLKMVLQHDMATFVLMRMVVINEENHTLEHNNNKHNDLNYYANCWTSPKHIYTQILSTNWKRCNVVLMCLHLLYSSCKLYRGTNQLQETASDKNYEDGADCWDAKRTLSRGHKSVFLPLCDLPLNKYLACIKPFVSINTGSAHSYRKMTLPILQKCNRQTCPTIK